MDRSKLASAEQIRHTRTLSPVFLSRPRMFYISVLLFFILSYGRPNSPRSVLCWGPVTRRSTERFVSRDFGGDATRHDQASVFWLYICTRQHSSAG